MARPASDRRERLTAAAARLALTHGLAATTIGAVAQEAGLPAGSVYYYFKTKDDLARAVLAHRAQQYSTLFAAWETLPDPRERLLAYVTYCAEHVDSVREHGGDITALSADARKQGPELADAADQVVRVVLNWTAAQFELLGFAPETAAARALHLITGLEGAAAMAHALGSEVALDREAAHLARWITNAKAER